MGWRDTPALPAPSYQILRSACSDSIWTILRHARTISIVTTLELMLGTSRASDAERDHAINLLSAHAASGRLSHDTFQRRLDAALRARRRSELKALVADLPTRGRLAQWLINTVEMWSDLRHQLRVARRAPQLPRLSLPQPAPYPLRIGRGPGCEILLTDASVSRKHAELLHLNDEWVLRDLRSTNGTTVNGWRITGEVVIRPGDHVSFGNLHFRLGAH